MQRAPSRENCYAFSFVQNSRGIFNILFAWQTRTPRKNIRIMTLEVRASLISNVSALIANRLQYRTLSFTDELCGWGI